MEEVTFRILAIVVICIAVFCWVGISYFSYKANNPYKQIPSPESFAGQTFSREEYKAWMNDIHSHGFSPAQVSECIRHLNHRWRCINHCEPPTV